jgi:hypothetical protein
MKPPETPAWVIAALWAIILGSLWGTAEVVRFIWNETVLVPEWQVGDGEIKKALERWEQAERGKRK